MRTLKSLFYLLFVIIALFQSNTMKATSELSCACDPIRDSLALVDLYNATDGANWTNPWDLNLSIDNWQGVIINSTTRCVTALNLSGRNLQGRIPASISNLEEITNIILSSNLLSDTIPNEIGNLNNLVQLDLKKNNLGGNLPTSLGNLSNLSNLSLDNNCISGSIPIEISNLAELTILNLQFNKLNGAIPSSIGNLSKLTQLDFSGNQLSDSIPSSIGNLIELTSLQIAGNDSLSGPIPNSIGNLLELTRIDFSKNNLIGSIPSSIGNLSNLNQLRLNDNCISGSIPIEISNLAELTILSLQSNKLNGAIPNTIGNLSKLTQLDFSGNQLSDSIPSSIGNLIELTSLRIASNDSLSGAIPNSIGNLLNLTRIDFSKNNLIGSIPSSIGNLSNLNELRLNNNALSGSIPVETGNLSNLTILRAQDNQLNSTLPATIGNLERLDILDLSANELVGSIPRNFGQLSQLTSLILNNNTLDSDIPLELGNLISLQELNLRNNNLSGEIPQDLGKLVNLESLRLDNNKLSGSIPIALSNLVALKTLNLFANQLSGSIPPELGNLSDLEILRLFGNLLTGAIPSSLGNLSKLQTLELSQNRLTGSIPGSLGNLDSLVSLRLFSNYLSGCLDQNLSGLCDNPMIQQVNLLPNGGLELPSEFNFLTDFCENGAGGCIENDDCEDAIEIVVDSDPCGRNSQAVILDGATESSPRPVGLCADTSYVSTPNAGKDVWFKVIPSATRNLFIRKDSLTNIDLHVQAYSSCAATANDTLACASLSESPFSMILSANTPIPLDTGAFIYLRVWDNQNMLVDASGIAKAEISAHELDADSTKWALCDFPLAINPALNEEEGSGVRAAIEAIVQYPDSLTEEELAAQRQEYAEAAIPIGTCGCTSKNIDLWRFKSLADLEFYRKRNKQIKEMTRAEVDTVADINYNYIIEEVPCVDSLRELSLNSFTANDQQNVQLAMDKDGNFVAVWSSKYQDGSGYGIYGKRFNKQGSPLGQEFLVNTTTLNSQERPSIAMDANGNFLVTWVLEEDNGADLGIYAQRFDSTGMRVGTEFSLIETSVLSTPQAAMDSIGNFVVVWDLGEIYALRFDSSGAAIGSEFIVNTTLSGTQRNPKVAMGADGAFVITWETYQGSTENRFYDIAAMKFQADGIAMGNEFIVNTEFEEYQTAPAVAINSNGAFAIAWMSRFQQSGLSSIFAQRYDQLCMPNGTSIAVDTFAGCFQRYPNVSYGNNEELIVAWQDDRNLTDEDIWARVIDSQGNPSDSSLLVNTFTLSNQTNANLVADNNGNVVVAWNSFDQDGSVNGVYGQRLQKRQENGSTLISKEFIRETCLEVGNVTAPIAYEEAGIYQPDPNPATSVRVAVLDTGVDLDHPFLQNALWQNNPMNDPLDCYDNDLNGYDFVNDDGVPDDKDGHGTGINGVIAKNFPSDIDLQLMNLKFYEQGRRTLFDAVCAIYYAIEEGADIINLSWGFESEEFPEILSDAIVAADSVGILVVTSAGNNAKDNDRRNKWPSNFSKYDTLNLRNVLTVAAYEIIEDKFRLAKYSNFGRNNVDIAARGFSETTAIGGRTNAFAGTSIAAPEVARVAAIIKGRFPELFADEIKDCILSTSLTANTLADLVSNNRVLSPDAALACAATKLAARSCESDGLFIPETLSSSTVYESSEIICNSRLEPGSSTTFAAQTIRLLPGFHAQKNANFDANTMCGVASVENETVASRSVEVAAKEMSPIKIAKSANLTIAPNPASERVNLFFTSKAKQQVVIQLKQLNGQTVKEIFFDAIEGNHQYSIYVTELPTGIYLLQLQTKFGREIKKIVVER